MDLTEATDALRAVLGRLAEALQAALADLVGQLPGVEGEALIAALKDYLPLVADPYVQSALDYSLVWYEDLAPDVDYVPTPPAVPDDGEDIGQLFPVAKLHNTIEWAVHTSADAAAATAKLAGSLDRMVYDASRAVVEHNAVAEKVKYARVARPGACRWCRLMATRGAVFTSAANSIKGHDSCHCVAVPVRQGTTFVRPQHYKAWDDEYAAVARQLNEAGEQVTLAKVLAAMA